MSHEDYPSSVDLAWQEIERISFGRVIPDCKETLLAFIEDPLKEAVGTLYEKGILTFGSSCNEIDRWQGLAWIGLDWEPLSDVNKLVVSSYQYSEHREIRGRQGEAIPIVGLNFPVAEEDRPEDIAKRAKELADLFEDQRPSLQSDEDVTKVVVSALFALNKERESLLTLEQVADRTMGETGFRLSDIKAVLQHMLNPVDSKLFNLDPWIMINDDQVHFATNGLWLLEDAFGSSYDYDQIDLLKLAQRILKQKKFFDKELLIS